MKKKILILLVLLLPVISSAQWSIVPSVSLGSGKADNNFMGGASSKFSYEASVTGRYAFDMFFVSTGVGFNDYRSESGYRIYREFTGYPEFQYQSVYIPISVGLIANKWKVYPIIETGINVLFPTMLKDMSITRTGRILATGEHKDIAISYFISAGAGYPISKRLALELKFKYSDSGDLSKATDGIVDNFETSWRFIGGQLSLAIKL